MLLAADRNALAPKRGYCGETNMELWMGGSKSFIRLGVKVPSLSTLSKNPMTAMSLSATKALASSTVARVLAGGPVFFSSQETMVSAVRPDNFIDYDDDDDDGD